MHHLIKYSLSNLHYLEINFDYIKLCFFITSFIFSLFESDNSISGNLGFPKLYPIRFNAYFTGSGFTSANKLSINENRLILTDVHRGSLAVHAVIIDLTQNEEKKVIEESKKFEEITKIDEKPLIDSLIISPEILDKRGIWP